MFCSMTVPPRDWTEIHWPEISEAGPARWIAVLPLAATEQHGPHLPLRTDVLIAEAYLERVRGLLGARRDAMLAALDRELPEVRITRPEGGYFLWAQLGGVDAAELLTRAEAAGVTFVKGTDFDGEPDTLRLAYSFVSVDEIAEGVSRLAATLAVPV